MGKRRNRCIQENKMHVRSHSSQCIHLIMCRSRSIYRVNVNNFTSKILVYQSDEELVGAVIHPLKRYYI